MAFTLELLFVPVTHSPQLRDRYSSDYATVRMFGAAENVATNHQLLT
jgi:hypothetical protein